MGEAQYKRLIVWQKADFLVKQIYNLTKNFPKEEIYGVTSQLRRAVLSVPLNIVEGNSRQSQKEKKHFLSIALGSLSETEYLLDISKDLGYLPEDQCLEVQGLRNEVGKLLWNFYQSC